MSRIAGVVVRTHASAHRDVGDRLGALPEIEIAGTTEHGYSAVLTAETARQQETLHTAIREWPGVLEISVAFQSADIDEEAEEAEVRA
jgi:nitrate reductase NapAB chaperone NapD